MKTNGEMLQTKKISLDDLNEKNFEAARNIIKHIVNMQSTPGNPALGHAIIAKLRGRNAGLDAGLNAGLHAGLHAGLYDGLYAGLRAGLSAGLRAGLDDGLSAGLNDGLNDGLYAGLRAGLDAGLNAGLHAGLHAGLDDGLSAGLRAGLRDGLYDGLHAGLRAGLDDGLSAGLYDELYAGLRAGLDAGLNAGLHAGLDDGLYAGLHAGLEDSEIKYGYVGIWWSWWLARYLIAKQWGCQLDMQKLGLLYAYCMHCPIVGKIDKGGKEIPVIISKPTKIHWSITGTTLAPFNFPIYELHRDGGPAVEHQHLPLYFWHNVRMPEYVGKVASADWRSEWIVTEKNSEVRRILIKEIGYEKMLQVLEAKRVDAWREYELLTVNLPDHPVAYNLLKMSCPSTTDKHILRVPPEMTSAREAITWVNHGIDPETFVTEH
jgi:hypothetical protein